MAQRSFQGHSSVCVEKAALIYSSQEIAKNSKNEAAYRILEMSIK